VTRHLARREDRLVAEVGHLPAVGAVPVKPVRRPPRRYGTRS